MKKPFLFLFALLSGLLFTLAWPAHGFPALLFISFVPLFYIEDEVCKNHQRFSNWSILSLSYIAFFVWNVLTTWWIYNSTAVGAILAILLNSLFMAITFSLFHWAKKHLSGYRRGHSLVIFFWLTFEYFHLNWDLSWSWLNLGNVFASRPSWVQWYAFTGTFGGDVWVLLVNISVYYVILELIRLRFSWSASLWPKIAGVAGLICIPLLLSLTIYFHYEEKGPVMDVVVVQPNIDPYTEQYSLPSSVVMNRMFHLARQKMETDVDLVVFPESAIQEDLWEDSVASSISFRQIQSFLKDYPGATAVFGASSFKAYTPVDNIPLSARYSQRFGLWYDAFNTAIFTDTSGHFMTYHKSKLVVGVEKMPYPQYLHFLEKYAINLGGTIGTLGISRERSVFQIRKKPVKMAAAICYESIYGEFFSGFVKNGANLMCIITNDGWWKNTPGHRQHLSFAPLRAIETRRNIVRSANTGISCFVNQRGDIAQATPYWEPAVIRQKVHLNDQMTFYVKYGDYLGRWATYGAVLLLLLVFIAKVRRR